MDTNAQFPPQTLLRWLKPTAFHRRAIGEMRSGVLPTADRKVLEGVILPFYMSLPDVQTILNIGSPQMTEALRRLTARHIDDLDLESDTSPAANSYDLVLIDGVLGSELNSVAGCERILEACYCWLRPGGHLVIGWNDVPEAIQVDRLPALDCFTPYTLPALHSARQVTDTFTRHTFQFFRKPAPLLLDS
jgi:hypothetical protein